MMQRWEAGRRAPNAIFQNHKLYHIVLAIPKAWELELVPSVKTQLIYRLRHK